MKLIIYSKQYSKQEGNSKPKKYLTIWEITLLDVQNRLGCTGEGGSCWGSLKQWADSSSKSKCLTSCICLTLLTTEGDVRICILAVTTQTGSIVPVHFIWTDLTFTNKKVEWTLLKMRPKAHIYIHLNHLQGISKMMTC